MLHKLGISAYVSKFNEYKDWYAQFTGQHVPVFTSLHIPEEMNPDYAKQAEEMLTWFKDRDFYLIVDISPRTLTMLELDSLDALVDKFGIQNIRLDFGFEVEDVLNMTTQPDITFNASQQALFNEIQQHQLTQNYYFMHNFYPRPETGNDADYFEAMNLAIRELGQEPIAFIASNLAQRGPIYEGLPTLEHHRNLLPYIQFVELVRIYGIQAIFIGDYRIDDVQLKLIKDFIETNIVSIPIEVDDDYQEILNQTFTIRTDSPKDIFRLVESRDYKPKDDWTLPRNHLVTGRRTGDITLDNDGYERYAGELQILNTELPADSRVNVIGRVDEEYIPLLASLQRDTKLRFIRQ